jgi:cytochrome d ubiquinol oxidase subunit II
MLFDYVTLKVIWWVLVGAVLILYATTAGFDFGVTLMLPFLKRKAKFADNDNERRVLLNTISATWDGNQTWLVFAGGALFVIWPVVYSSIFSGLYAAMLFILWSFFLRPPGFDYRGKLPSEAWRKMWDWSLFISAFFPVLIFGLIIGNLFVGMPFKFDPITLRSYYEGNFFDLLNVFGIVCALASLFMCLMHGSAHLNRRTEGGLSCYFRKLHCWFSLVFLILMTVGGVLLAFKVNGYHLVSQAAIPTYHPLSNVVSVSIGGWFKSMQVHAWKWVAPVLVYVAVILSILTERVGKGGLSFWLSSISVAATVITFGSTLFPFLVPSSLDPAQSQTVWDAVSSHYTLMGMLYITVVMLIIIITYKFLGYGAMWNKKSTLSVEDVKANDHTFY